LPDSFDTGTNIEKIGSSGIPAGFDPWQMKKVARSITFAMMSGGVETTIIRLGRPGQGLAL
jgi:hypothetical protein